MSHSFGAQTADIIITRGDTPVIPVEVKDGSSASYDITGGTFVLTVDPSKTPADDSANVFSVAGVISDGPGGKVTFQPTAVQTDQPPGQYFYDIQMDLSGSIRTILKGQFIIEQDISKG